ncbi:MAG: trigger factor [Desulfobacterales bacterium]
MKVTVEDVNSVKKIVHVEIPEETVAGELESAYKELKKTAKIKGFRPGKAPRSVLERMFKKDVHRDVASKLIQDTVFGAIQEADLKVIAPPKIDPRELTEKQEFKYDATVEVNPDIPDIDYKGLNLKRTLYEVSDREIDMQLHMLQRNLAAQQPVDEDRPVRENDFVLIDYEGFLDGRPYPAVQKTENFTLKIGEGSIAADFDNQLIGMKKGDTKDITVSFPSDHDNPDLAGKTVTFNVVLQQIREEILPDIDDEMAKKFGPYQTLDELKSAVSDNLRKGYDQRTEQEINEQIFSALLEKTDFEVPEALTEMELDGIVSETEQRLKYQNMSMEDLGLTREGISEKYRDTAERQVRRHLILSKLIDQLKLEISDEDLETGFQDMAQTVDRPIDEIKGFYDQNPDKLDFFKHTLLEKQVLKLIIEDSQVTEIQPEDKATGSPESKEGGD